MLKIKEEVFIGSPAEGYSEEERLKIPGEIKKLEAMCSADLPENYKNFLQENDGAYLDDLTCVDLLKNEKKCIIEFNSLLNVNEVYDEGLLWAKKTWGNVLPNEYIILTSESLLVMNCKTEKIYYWDEKDSWDEKDLYFVANDFEDLISKIRLEDWDKEEVMFGEI